MSEIHSIHTFMFPFRWDYIRSIKPKECDSYSERTNLSDFDRVFSSCNTLRRNIFQIDSDNENYNEYTYFHEHARKALYDIGNVTNSVNKNEVVYYDLDGGSDDLFCIELIDGKSYQLKIDNVCLHIYSTGIGILSLNLSNFKYEKAEDIIIINGYGRRIYPQFLKNNNLKSTKKTLLADRIHGKIGKIIFDEDFSQYENSISTESTFLPPDFIKKIFGYQGQEEESTSRSFVFRKSHERKGNIRISKLTDDRMFYLCYYKNSKIANQLAKKEKSVDTEKFEYLGDSYWYAYVFGDTNVKDITIKNKSLQEDLIAKSSYSRWVDYKNQGGYDGSLFGMTRDSFVCIGDWPELIIQMQTMYYQMAILCLAQRASVLRFSYEVSLITDQLEENKDATRDIKDLYKNYIQFINKIYFREVTSQLQGIEMYNQFQNVMGLEKDVKDLDSEIRELHTYISMVEQSNLSKVAVWFLPAGVLVGLLGMNTYSDDVFKLEYEFNSQAWAWIGIVVFISISSVVLLTKVFNRKIR